MAEPSVDQFDFYDWAGLYQENPQEFEAKRSAMLMIELTRGSAKQCAAGRALLESFDKQVQGCDPQERLQVAMSMMAESARQLGTELSILKNALDLPGTQEKN
ncbi:MAG: DUF3135 domain-containing protein [Granulosicoccus sp.]